MKDIRISRNVLKLYSLGQSLISLVIFMVIAIIVVSGAVAVIIVNSKTTTKFYQGMVSYDLAEAGAENALIKLLRDPAYTGETLTVGLDTAVIEVTGGGGSPYTITSRGLTGNFQRTIQVIASYNNILTVTSWREL